jgi:hypothetical protein
MHGTIGRREFVKGALAGLALATDVLAAQKDDGSGLPKRPLGRTGEMVSIIVRDLGIGADMARRYSLSLPITALVCGIQSRANLRQDIAIAREFKPLTEDEVVQVLAKAEPRAKDGRMEAYKLGNCGCDWHHKQA